MAEKAIWNVFIDEAWLVAQASFDLGFPLIPLLDATSNTSSWMEVQQLPRGVFAEGSHTY